MYGGDEKIARKEKRANGIETKEKGGKKKNDGGKSGFSEH